MLMKQTMKEIVFFIDESVEGSYEAQADGYSIYKTLLEIVDCLVWIPAFAGMTGPGNIIPVFSLAVIPAKAGIQS